jgi:lactoylglutathione lyase
VIRFLLALAALTSGPLLRAEDAARPFHIPTLYHVGYWVRDIAKSRAFYETYLGFAEPYVLKHSDGTLQLAVVKVNERQVIYLFPDPTKIKPNGDNLDHLGLLTDDAQGLRDALVARGVKMGEPHPGHIGDLIMGIRDPDGHPFELTQLEPWGQLLMHQGRFLPASRISSHLRSATIVVSDPPAASRFYRDILGFVDIGTVGGADRLRVPDGADFVELVPAESKSGISRERSVPQFTLEVPDAGSAAEILSARARSGGFPAPSPVTIAADGKRETSVVDPDGTRVVLSE